MGNEIENIVIIGTGNVSYHLVRAFLARGLAIPQVVAHSESSASRFRKAIPDLMITVAPSLLAEADLYILAVNDDRIDEAAGSLKITDQLVVHTSGTVPMDILRNTSAGTGVFYPLQTLSFGKDTDFRQVPLCVEANSPENLERLASLARKISDKVFAIDSHQRRVLHLAAVFASNFSYHLCTVAAKLLKAENITPDILHPLMAETLRKAVSHRPGALQTGPAARNDKEVIRMQLDMLQDHPEYSEIYRILTESIINESKDQKNEL